MSADLVLYAIPERLLPVVQKLDAVDWFSEEDAVENGVVTMSWDTYWDLSQQIYNDPTIPSVWIGQVSWLKAGLIGDEERYIPGPVQGVAKIVDQRPLLTGPLAKQILVAMNLPDRSIYGKGRYYYDSHHRPYGSREVAPGVWRYNRPSHDRKYAGTAPRQRVKRWLTEHQDKGLYLYGVSE